MRTAFPTSGPTSTLMKTRSQPRPIPRRLAGSVTKTTRRSSTSFVQFYPTLKPVAKKFGTYKESARMCSSTPQKPCEADKNVRPTRCSASGRSVARPAEAASEPDRTRPASRCIHARTRRELRSARDRELCFSPRPLDCCPGPPSVPPVRQLQSDCRRRNSPATRRKLQTCPLVTPWPCLRSSPSCCCA